MKKPGALSVLLVSLPFLAGCFTVSTVPVPATAPEREELDVRGVVVREAGGGEQVINFNEVLESSWTPTALSVVATVDNPDNGNQEETITRLFSISTLAALQVRKLDAGKTSAIIGGVFVATAAILAVLITGQADKYQF